MTYEEALSYLYSQLPMFSRIGAAAYKEDIHNTVALCDALDNPQNKFKSIHIAGTNGKGSTSHMLAAMLQQQGFKTGLYTSPHIKDFGERIRINGKMIDQDFVVAFTEKTKSICQDIQPSFFELTVAMAFEYFALEKVDIAIIETGLGGRLDSTNIINPELSVITNIGLDHQNLLGNTLEEISFEKAGIIKNNTPVIIGETIAASKSVFVNKASECNVNPVFAENEYAVEHRGYQDHRMICEVRKLNNQQTFSLLTDLCGQYQLKNLRTVLSAVDSLRLLGYQLEKDKVQNAVANTRKITGFWGRWDVISQAPIIICDVAHNEDGIKNILSQLNQQYKTKHWHFVMGFVNDKDISKMLKLLPNHAHYYFTNAHIPRALPHNELKEQANHIGLKGDSFDDVNHAVQKAKESCENDDVVIVCGSFFILSELHHYRSPSNI